MGFGRPVRPAPMVGDVPRRTGKIADYEPGPVDLPMEADFKDPASQTADSAELSAQTKAMRAATEKARDAEAESYADYWRKRSTRER